MWHLWLGADTHSVTRGERQVLEKPLELCEMRQFLSVASACRADSHAMIRDKFECPFCGAFVSRVIRSGYRPHRRAIRRRRQCDRCQRRFWTKEALDDSL